ARADTFSIRRITHVTRLYAADHRARHLSSADLAVAAAELPATARLLHRIAAFGPLFVWGASGDLWPALIAAGCCGLGVYLIYALRRPLLASLDDALSG